MSNKCTVAVQCFLSGNTRTYTKSTEQRTKTEYVDEVIEVVIVDPGLENGEPNLAKDKSDEKQQTTCKCVEGKNGMSLPWLRSSMIC